MNTQTKPFDYKAFNEFKKTPKYWGMFVAGNSQHKYILSLLRQMDWIVTNRRTGRSFADMERFGAWLQSDKSPVRSPLKKMSQPQTSRIISALESMVGKYHK